MKALSNGELHFLTRHAAPKLEFNAKPQNKLQTGSIDIGEVS